MIMFNELDTYELEYLNGGGIVGAAVGYLAGLAVGTVGCAVACIDSSRSGSSGRDAAKAGLTVFVGSVVTGTVIGACATGVI